MREKERKGGVREDPTISISVVSYSPNVMHLLGAIFCQALAPNRTFSTGTPIQSLETSTTEIKLPLLTSVAVSEEVEMDQPIHGARILNFFII